VAVGRIVERATGSAVPGVWKILVSVFWSSVPEVDGRVSMATGSAVPGVWWPGFRGTGATCGALGFICGVGLRRLVLFVAGYVRT
jgi:hypothetical protein